MFSLIVADLCSPDPCRYGTHCIQADEESYQCVKNLCTPNPCSNGGKCIVVNDEGYECACPRGWRGKNCIGIYRKFNDLIFLNSYSKVLDTDVCFITGRGSLNAINQMKTSRDTEGSVGMCKA